MMKNGFRFKAGSALGKIKKEVLGQLIYKSA